MNSRTRKIGIMGGTFDPIHYAHIELAKGAYSQYELDEVWIVPNGNPPHKKDSRQVDVSHRLAMAYLAVEGIPGLSVCDMEANSDVYHYTYELLVQLNKDYPDTQFYFIMGADSLYYFEEWKCPEIISRESILLAATRDHHTDDELLARIEYLNTLFPCDIRLMTTPNMDVSSNEIRARLKAGESIRDLVPEKVEAYIKEHHLYT